MMLPAALVVLSVIMSSSYLSSIMRGERVDAGTWALTITWGVLAVINVVLVDLRRKSGG